MHGVGFSAEKSPVLRGMRCASTITVERKRYIFVIHTGLPTKFEKI